MPCSLGLDSTSCCHCLMCCYRLGLQLGQQVLYLPVSVNLGFLMRFMFQVLGTAFLYILSSSTVCFVRKCAVSEHLKNYLNSKGFALSRSRAAIQPCWMSGRCFKYGKRFIQYRWWFCQDFFFHVSPLVYNLDWSQVIDLEIFFVWFRVHKYEGSRSVIQMVLCPISLKTLAYHVAFNSALVLYSIWCFLLVAMEHGLISWFKGTLTSFAAYFAIILGFQCCVPRGVVHTPFEFPVYVGGNSFLPYYFEE